MDNPETLATLGTQDKENKTHNTESRKDKQHGRQVNPDDWEGYAVPTSYKTPTVFLIYRVKSDKCLGCDRGKKHQRKK